MVALLSCGAMLAAQATPAVPVIVVETLKGTFAFETYPREAPKTVAHVVDLVRRGFYDGQRVHRAIPGVLAQWGDPQSREPGKEADWGRGPAASSGTPVGVSEISKKRLHVAGAVAIAHPGRPAAADSQIYVTLAPRPDLDGYYTVFGRVIFGADVPAAMERGDVITRMYVRE
jgi:cyclophilin family peptidyl-prolyl cis-trans isomerase